MSSGLASGPVLVIPIVCRECKQNFTQPAGTDLAEKPTVRTAKFVNRLMMHLQERHPNIAAKCGALGNQYAGMLMLLHFDLSGDVRAQADQVRWQINRQTRAVEVQDRRIEERVRAIFAKRFTVDELEYIFDGQAAPGASINAGLGRELVELLKEMRDNITEAGRYPS